MITDGGSDDNTEPDASDKELVVKLEVKQEGEDVDGEGDADWNNFVNSEREVTYINDDAIENSDDIDDVKKELREDNDEGVPSRKRRAKRKSAPVSFKEDESNESEVEEEKAKNGRKCSNYRKKQKKKKDDEWNESMEHYSPVRKNAKQSPRARLSRSVKNRTPALPQVLNDVDEGSSGENFDVVKKGRGKGEKSARKRKPKKKQANKDSDDSEVEGYVGKKKSKRPECKRKYTVLQMPEMFASMEEFHDYIEKRVSDAISDAIKDDEDPRIHHHFYLAVHECVQAGFKQSLVTTQEEVNEIWKKYDDLAGQKYDSRERKPESLKKTRSYVKVAKVHLKEEEYQDMIRKTRRLKTSAVRDYVLKSIEENNGENKIINNLQVRRGFFEMLSDVPGSCSKNAILSPIKKLWKDLIYGKREDWSKYLANKERVLEKRKELMNPENVKVRRYLYRQAYVASLPKEELERRSREKAEYFREKRRIMDEEKRKELRERNKRWRMNLTGEKREKYIERVYSAIRKRNERLKYERAGLEPPEELLPLRKGRYSNVPIKSIEQNSKSENESSTAKERIGKGRARGYRGPTKFGICHKKRSARSSVSVDTSTVPIHSSAASTRATEQLQLITKVVQPPEQPLDHSHNITPCTPTTTTHTQDFAHSSEPPPDYFGQDVVSQQQHSLPCPQNYNNDRDHLPKQVSTAISDSSQSSATSPLSTSPHNYSIRKLEQQEQISQKDSPLQGHKVSYHQVDEFDDGHQDFEDDCDASPPTSPQYYPDDPESNSYENFPVAATDPTVFKTVKHESQVPIDASSQKTNTVSTSITSSSSSSLGTPEICEECGMQFARSYDLRKHITFAHSEDESNRLCPVCGREFNLPRSLWRHIVRHHGGMSDTHQPKVPRPTRVYHGPCKCELCGKEFLTGDMRKAYRDHMRRAHRSKDKEKSVSSRPPGPGTPILLKPSSAESLPNPPPEVRQKTVRCELCDKEMLFLSLKRHMRSVHPVNLVKSFACEECGKTFKDRRYLTDHVRLTHSFNFWKMIESRNILVTSYSKEDPGKELFTCTICSENVSERIQFRTHVLKKHSDVFKEISSSGAAYSNRECEVCKATFPKEIQLRDHLTTEHPDMCWNCPHCAKFICSQSSLQKHIKNVHSTGKRQNSKRKSNNQEINGKKCPSCGDIIDGGEPEMWMHVKAMHAEIIVYCKYCNKPKWSKRLLSDHQRICRLNPEKDKRANEEGEEESSNKLPCTVCGTKLKHAESLHRHMKDVHKMNITEFKCEEPDCEKVFTNKTKLYDHLEEDHGSFVKRRWKKKVRCSSKETEKLKRKESSSSSSKPEPVQRRVSARNRAQVMTQDVRVTLERLSKEKLSFYLKTELE